MRNFFLFFIKLFNSANGYKILIFRGAKKSLTGISYPNQAF